MPVALRERIAADVKVAMSDPIVIERLNATGQMLNFGTAAEFVPTSTRSAPRSRPPPRLSASSRCSDVRRLRNFPGIAAPREVVFNTALRLLRRNRPDDPV